MFEAFLNWFERHKFGVVGTLMLHTFMLFGMAMSKLPADENAANAPPEMVMELAAPEDLPLDPMLQPPTSAAVEVKNLTSNALGTTRSMQLYPGRAAQERIAGAVEEDVNAFAAAEFARLDSARKASGKEVVMPKLDPSKFDPKNYLPEKSNPVKVEGLTTVSYQFIGEQRSDIILNVPAYLCKGQGTVVIQISVESGGAVRKAEIDGTRTTTSDECILENALTSAQGAVFTSSSTASDPQKGTITYVFLAQ
ncbi:MAG: hypothetical protein IPO90_07285 [Flavobacteriales bacterium]|nr:hypothetical protein [Flavobacteriales bacterium]